MVVYRGSSKSVIVGKPASQTEPELAAKQQERERQRETKSEMQKESRDVV